MPYTIPFLISINPTQATMDALASMTFVATVSGGTGTVIWLVDGIVGGNSTVGTIVAGVYTAPAPAGAHSVTASVTSGPNTVLANAGVIVTNPVATASSVGTMKPDGTSITITGAGVISAAPGGSVTSVTGTAPISVTAGSTPNVSVATATTGALGVVKPDGTTITISAGVISAPGGGGGGNRTYHDVTGSRSQGSVYQNTGSNDMWVTGYFSSLSTGTGTTYGYVGPTSTPATAVFGDQVDAVTSGVPVNFGFWVPAGYYYEVTSITAGTNLSLLKWYEFY